jgi:8-oxo-dGTP pyrophosphatase MutT (NUDIX family)
VEFDPRQLPSPFYRVATRAIILDSQQRLLVMENNEGEVELPGGGWEFDETLQECVTREIQEELGVELASIGKFVGAYRGRGGRNVMYLRIAFKVELKSYDFKVNEMKRAWFVTREEFLQLDLRPAAEHGILEYIDEIWSN